MNASFLDEIRAVPIASIADRVVAWTIFRSKDEALRFLPHIHLATGQKIVGGTGKDSVAPYWWVGVKVTNIEDWGHKAAINKRGRHGD